MIKNENNQIGIYPENLVDKVENYLDLYLNEYKHIPGKLRDAIFYSILNGGKRIRPVLSLAVAESLGFDSDVVIPTACAIEFIHTYSLIHDDLPAIDNDDMRRGKPSCHKKFGEDIAILAGDALFAESFNIILKYQKSPPEVKLRLFEEIISAAGASGMVAGQTVDVCSTGHSISKKLLEYMHLNKTSKLIIAAIRTSAIICKAKGSTLNALSSYGTNIGMVFQITDDIIDIESSTIETGKSEGKDIKDLKNTFPSIWGLEKSRKIAKEKTEKAVEIIKGLSIIGDTLVNIAYFILNRKA